MDSSENTRPRLIENILEFQFNSGGLLFISTQFCRSGTSDLWLPHQCTRVTRTICLYIQYPTHLAWMPDANHHGMAKKKQKPTTSSFCTAVDHITRESIQCAPAHARQTSQSHDMEEVRRATRATSPRL